MSIGAKPWEGGGAASVPDASETVKGKIRIATSTEASDGTDDLTAMTPAKVKARIDAALVGGVEYKGDYTGQSLVTAKQGDMYISNGDQTLAGVSLTNNDHIIFNQDAADPVTASMFDKIDNTDQVTSVNGQTGPVSLGIGDLNNVTISGGGADGDFVRYDSGDSRWENVTAASINLSDFNNDLSLSGNQITDVASQTGSTFTATANVIYVVGYTTGTQTITFPDASASTDGDLIGLTSTGTTDYSLDLVSSDGSTNDLLNMSNQTKGGTNGALSITVKQELILFACDGTRWRQLSRELADVAKTGAYSDLSGTPTLATVATTGAYSDLSGTPTLATVATTGAYSDLSGTPTLATVATTGAYSDLSGTPTLATVATTGAYSDLTGEPTALSDLTNDLSADDFAADHLASNYTPANANIDGHLSGIDSALASAGGATDLDGLSDVTITTPTSSGQILRNNGSGQFVNTSLSIVDDTTPQLGGNLDPNGFGVSANLVPSTANNISLGSATAEWSDLYIGDNGKIFFGNDQDVELIHDPDNGLRLDLGVAESSNDPQLELRSQNSGTIGPRIKFNHESASPAAGDRIGNISFNGEDSGGTTQDYSQIVGKIVDPTAGAEAGSVSIMPYPGMANNRGLHVEGVAGQVTQVKVNIDHDGGNYGLHLNNTLVTTTAAELNLLDGGSTVGSSITITDTDGFIINDGGVSKLIPASDIKTYAASGATGISSVSEDLDPTLGGDLKVAGYAITSTSNGDVTINPDGTGDISVGADIIPDADATHTLGSEDNRFITLHSELNGAVQFKARNETGGPLTKGQAVYISGVSGSVPLVSLARANSASTMPAHGLLAADVSNNADVQVISFGNLTEYNTTTHSLSLGDTVYVSAATAGALTSSAPAGETNLIQNIGKVVRASATEGIIKVGGAGRSAATPNLDNGKIFLGNGSNQAVSTALSSINLTSFNDDLGSTYQPLDAGLTSISGLTTAADNMIYTTASDTYAVTGLTAAGRAILDDADAAAQRTTLGLVIGTDVLANVVEDTTPQLGGNLDTNGQDIITTSNADLDLAPDGTGAVVLKGNTTGGSNQGKIKFNCENNSHAVTIQGPAHSAAATYTLTLPTSDGNPNQVLETDGSGVLSWVDQSSGGSAPAVTTDSSGTNTTISTSTGVEEIHLISNGSNNVVITIPAAGTVGAGYKYQIKRLGTGTCSVTPSSGTIDASSSFGLASQYDAVTLVSDGSNYFII